MIILFSDPSRTDSIKLQFNQEIDESYQGVHGTETGGTRASGLIKKLTHQGHTCWGDYCNILSRLQASAEDTKEYLRSIGMTKVFPLYFYDYYYHYLHHITQFFFMIGDCVRWFNSYKINTN